MKRSSSSLSDYEIRASAANANSAQSTMGNCTRASFWVGQRHLLEFCALQFSATLFSDSFVSGGLCRHQGCCYRASKLPQGLNLSDAPNLCAYTTFVESLSHSRSRWDPKRCDPLRMGRAISSLTGERRVSLRFCASRRQASLTVSCAEGPSRGRSHRSWLTDAFGKGSAGM